MRTGKTHKILTIMIKKTAKTIGVLMLSAAIFSGCTLAKMLKMAQEQQLKVTPSPVELHGDSVSFEMSALLPIKMLKKNYLYNVEPSYKYGDQIEKLGAITFKFEDFEGSMTEQPLIKKTFTFPYSAEKQGGDVVVNCSAAKSTGKAKSAPELPLAKGIITTSLLVRAENYVAYADHGYNNQEELEPTNVEFFFDKSKANLKYSEIRGGEGKKMAAFIADKVLTRTVNVVGMHSPEGTEKINTALAEDRPKAIEAYYRKMMKKYDYKTMADSINFVAKPVVQDWAEFKKALAASDKLSADEKSEITSSIAGGGSFVDQEKSLRKLSSYRKLVRYVYPELRTSKTEILSVKPKKTDAEMATLAGMISKGEAGIDTLNAEELGYAATLTPDLAEREAIYKALIKKTESAYAYNNLGAVHLEMAKKEASKDQRMKYLDMAKVSLDIAIKKDGLGEAHNNLAVIYTMKGDKLKALENYLAAAKKGGAADFNKGLRANLGASQIRHGKYADAKRSLAKSSQTPNAYYNLGLVQLLTNDYQTALKTFPKAAKDEAWAFYCSAIAHARLENKEGMSKALMQAIKLDSSLREKALKDLEFTKFSAGTAFKNAIK